MPKKEETLFGILLRGLLETIMWTVVYYVGIVMTVVGLGAAATYLTNRRKKSKK